MGGRCYGHVTIIWAAVKESEILHVKIDKLVHDQSEIEKSTTYYRALFELTTYES
jgi:hypothetical protein